MQRYNEISILYDHSQIPIFLARNNSTLEVLALQRIPIMSYLPSSMISYDPKTKRAIVKLADCLSFFPFIRNWTNLPRSPNIITLREVILEEGQLFIVSERYSETLVRYLRRNGVLNRVQVKNHALNTDGDEKHDRACAALVARWQSEDVMPDENDEEFCGALGITNDITNFNVSTRHVNSPPTSPSHHASSSSIMNGSLSFADYNNSNKNSNQSIRNEFLNVSVRGNSLKRRTSSLAEMIGRSKAASDDASSSPLSSHLQQQQRKRTNSIRRRSSVGPRQQPQLQNQANDQHHQQQQQQQQQLEHPPEDLNENGEPMTEEEKDRRMILNAPLNDGNGGNTNTGAPMLYDLVPDHDLAIRFADIFRVPAVDDVVRVVLYQILTALADIHEAGYAHGSISPKHIVLGKRNDLSTLSLTFFRKLSKYTPPPPSLLSKRKSDDDDDASNKSTSRTAASQHQTRKVSISEQKEQDTSDATSNRINIASFRTMISDAIQNSKTLIAEEEEWRERRKSLVTAKNENLSSPQNGRGGVLTPTSPQQDSALRPRRGPKQVVFGFQNGEDGSDSATENRSIMMMSRTNKHHASSSSSASVANFAASVMKTSAVNQLFGGPDEAQEWENEEEEIFVNCVKKYTGLSNEEARTGRNDSNKYNSNNDIAIPHSDMYEREDVKCWLTVTHAAPEIILGYSPKIEKIATATSNEKQDDENNDEDENKKNNSNNASSHSTTMMMMMNNITPAGDIWSTAMVALELYTARPIVYGDNPRDVFFRAASQICGCPSQATDPEFHRWVMHATNGPLPTKGIRAVPLNSVIPMASASAIDLLRRMLLLDPSQRLSAREALEHPFFTTDVDDEEEEESDVDF